MDWTALVPIKQGGAGKSRLAGLLDGAARDRLAARMAEHVLAVLAASPRVRETVILSPERPEGWDGGWSADRGRGLNAELGAWRTGFGDGPLLVIHADLPLLAPSEVAALLDRAETAGAALATDRAGSGTNALALADGRALDFRFGPDSRRLHAGQGAGMAVVSGMGLAADLDTAEDFAFALTHGFVA
ncbi:MAG: 2-phospho-L-lactate guanylyltransferase [Sphingomonadales bacterium]|nr:2-phospho-L-lactate guanylyltransferase [Sphingomonadales bacterium]MDE2569461.1 2-phospho-L-lactate guanylyltransferase [Sphingomonadales bacterium]